MRSRAEIAGWTQDCEDETDLEQFLLCGGFVLHE